MFSDLEFWRLPQAALMTAWVPPQLLACKLSARCKVLDEQQQALLQVAMDLEARALVLRHAGEL